MSRNIRDDAERYHQNNINLQKRLIYISAEIDSDVAVEFIKNMDILEAASEERDIQVRLYTPGGDETAGWAIYDRIRQSPCTVIGEVCGDCSSMGTIILQAFDHRIASEHSLFLFHEGSSEIPEDHVQNVKAAAKLIDLGNDWMYKIYMKSTGKTRKQLERVFRMDRYLTAPMALKEKFIDEIKYPHIDPAWTK
ncbi:MAG: ATP-dependent Clp protease proteolytic subunit [Flavobacteriaceae bacterium]|nr:ATP-dependent Clp protease proteolytic subunit [Flavobacteriaceae bacterium]